MSYDPTVQQPSPEPTRVSQNASIEVKDDLLQDAIDRLPTGYIEHDGMIWRRSGTAAPVAICGPIFVKCHACDSDQRNWCMEVCFQSLNGTWKDAVVPLPDLTGAPVRVVSALIDLGFSVLGRPKDVCDLLRLSKPDAIAEAVPVAGWVDRALRTYVCPTGEVLSGPMRPGEPSPAHFVYTGRARITAKPRGALKEWTTALQPVRHSEAAIVGVCAAIAPVFLPATGHPSFLVHLHGNAAAAAMSCQVAASVWGPAGCLTLGWQEPVSRLVAEVAAAKDGLVIVTGYAPRHAAKLSAVTAAMAAMDSAGGTGGRVVILSTGAEPLTAGPDRSQGRHALQNVIDVDASAWDDTFDAETLSAAFAARGCFGPTVVRAAIDWGIRESQSLSLQIRCADILDALGQNHRTTDVETLQASWAFGALYAAGKFMGSRQLLFDRDAPLLEIFRKMFLNWNAQSIGHFSEVDRGLLRAVADEIRALTAAGALVDLDRTQGAIPADVVGWQDDHWFYLSSDALAAIAAAQAVRQEQLVDLLLAQELLRPGGERGHKFRLPSRVTGRPRAYRISPETLRFASVELAALVRGDEN